MKAFFNLKIWVFTIYYLFQTLNDYSYNLLYDLSFPGNYIVFFHSRHSLLFTKAANNLGIGDVESRRQSCTDQDNFCNNISDTDSFESDSDSDEDTHYDTSCTSDDSDSSSSLPSDEDIVSRLKSYLHKKMGKRASSFAGVPVQAKSCDSDSFDSDSFDSDSCDSDSASCRHYDTVYTSNDSDSSSDFSSDEDIVSRLKSYLNKRLQSRVIGSSGLVADNQEVPQSEERDPVPEIPKSTTATFQQSAKSLVKSSSSSEHPRRQRSKVLNLKLNTINLRSTKSFPVKSKNPNLQLSLEEQSLLAGHSSYSSHGQDPYTTFCSSVSNIRIRSPIKSSKKRKLIKTKRHSEQTKYSSGAKKGSVGHHKMVKGPSSTTGPTVISDCQVSSSSAAFSSHQDRSLPSSGQPTSTPFCAQFVGGEEGLDEGFALPTPLCSPLSVKETTERPCKRRAPPPPSHPPFSVKATAEKPLKRRAPPPPSCPPSSIKATAEKPLKRRAPPPPSCPPSSIRATTEKPLKRRAPSPPSHPPFSVKTATEKPRNHRTSSPSSHPPFSVKKATEKPYRCRTPSPPTSGSFRCSPSHQRFSPSSSCSPSSVKVTEKPLRRRAPPPPSSPSYRRRPASFHGSPLPLTPQSSPRQSTPHKWPSSPSTAEKSIPTSAMPPPRPHPPTIQSIHTYRMYNT
ncbi:signal peptide containing cysteine rich [Cryptosporidium sp. chipmunk genotype I]|uniref:signal peptide containing cysteine rich n=1 Tax=Cryptosporidium sp. chipmunk genotype I TaxID=1280935 RepID=UPI00351A5D5B|nr:signal peptide containing cysteine rich [Cryptosporidium sp. chipmunk genotype I]